MPAKLPSMAVLLASFCRELNELRLMRLGGIPNYWCITRYVKLRLAHTPGMPGTFSPPPRASDPDMHHGTCVTHVPWCMPGSLTSQFLWSRWRGKRSRHSRRMRNPLIYVSGKRPITKRSYWPSRLVKSTTTSINKGPIFPLVVGFMFKSRVRLKNRQIILKFETPICSVNWCLLVLLMLSLYSNILDKIYVCYMYVLPYIMVLLCCV